jgi:type VI secretion system secreted protein VgrG
MAKRLVKAKEYKVKDGDTLDSIASANGLTVKQLAQFNWKTDDAGPENKKFRDKLGSRTLDTDKKTYLLGKDDDPGILYIPELPGTPKAFATNGTHTITVKVPQKKTYKTSKCGVFFRPDDGWKGEFGFDWLRNGDWGNANNYKAPLLDGGYKSGTASGMTAAEARTAIKKEFPKLSTHLAGSSDYYVGVLNIFPDGLSGTPAPPSTCKLKMSIKIEEEAADSLTISLPTYKDDAGDEQPHFEVISGSLDLPKAVGTHSAKIELKCLHELKSQGSIKVIAITREPDGSYKEYIAGKIIVMPNSSSKRKKKNFVLVKVTTDVYSTGTPYTGAFTSRSKKHLRNALFQALVRPHIANGPTLDLSTNDEFLKTTSTGGTGKYYIRQSATKKGLNQDHADFFATVKDIFLKKPGNDKYKDYFTVFAFGERPYDKALGQVQDIGVQNLIVFPGDTDDCTLNHEALHGLGVSHSFKNDPADVDASAKFTFQQGKTDNVMDYTYDGSALKVWMWQWKLINK